MNRLIAGYVVFILFLLTVPFANYFIMHIGTLCPVNAPCLIPVWFHPTVYAPSGTLFAGLAFVLRDLLQRSLGMMASIIAVMIGTVLSYSFAGEVALAACVAYLLSELSDTIVYSWLQKYNLVLAIFVSASVGVFIDSIVFLSIAYHNYQYLGGLIVGKFWMVCLSIPVIRICRRYIVLRSEQYIKV